jgi:hypothetical protein
MLRLCSSHWSARSQWRSSAGRSDGHEAHLDPHIAAIERWLTEQPQLTALAIVGRLSEKYLEEYGTKQHSIVQRLLRAGTTRTGHCRGFAGELD